MRLQNLMRPQGCCWTLLGHVWWWWWEARVSRDARKALGAFRSRVYFEFLLVANQPAV